MRSSADQNEINRFYDSAIDEVLSDLKSTSLSGLHLPFTSAYVGRKRGSLCKKDQQRKHLETRPRRIKKVVPAPDFDRQEFFNDDDNNAMMRISEMIRSQSGKYFKTYNFFWLCI